jgi:mRNA interferase RelE/StbE
VKRIAWSERAREEIRALDREVAMRIFAALTRFVETGEGDIKRLQGSTSELRLRVGDYRVRFSEEFGDLLHIHSVRHRKDAYR